MKDSTKPCLHTLPKDVVYKDVVIIGNGPSGMVTSFMLDGNVPYLKDIPEELPIDDMLRARLSNLPPGRSLYEVDLMELAEGLEGRSQNPISLLMDNLLRPCADLGVQAESLVEWRHEPERRVEHVVLGRGVQAGGAWHTFPPDVRTLSPGAWLTLPPHTGRPAPPERLTARAVANYCRRYVHACRLQKYFRCGVIVDSVAPSPYPRGTPCTYEGCPLGANFCVSGYEKSSGRRFRYVCRRVVASSGGGDRPNRLSPQPCGHRYVLHHLAAFDRACTHLAGTRDENGSRPESVVIVGSGVSAADAVVLARRAGLHAVHLHRAPADALARLAPQTYPDYCQVYRMMCDGAAGEHANYTSYPNHVILDVSPLMNETDAMDTDDIEDYALRPKRVTILDMATNETRELTASLIGAFIGSKPDLFYLQTDTDTDHDETIDALDQRKHDEKQCFLKNHWHYLKSVLGQSIQSCKSRYLNYSEINGNTDTKCDLRDCVRRLEYNVIPYTGESKCKCDGIGYGIDKVKPVDCRANPVAIDKGTHELLYAPKGVYALGPLTADNFVRFIPGGALAIVSHIHKSKRASP